MKAGVRIRVKHAQSTFLLSILFNTVIIFTSLAILILHNTIFVNTLNSIWWWFLLLISAVTFTFQYKFLGFLLPPLEPVLNMLIHRFLTLFITLLVSNYWLVFALECGQRILQIVFFLILLPAQNNFLEQSILADWHYVYSSIDRFLMVNGPLTY